MTKNITLIDTYKAAALYEFKQNDRLTDRMCLTVAFAITRLCDQNGYTGKTSIAEIRQAIPRPMKRQTVYHMVRLLKRLGYLKEEPREEGQEGRYLQLAIPADHPLLTQQ